MSKSDAAGAVIAAADRAMARSAGAEAEQIEMLPPSRFDPKIDPVEHGQMADAYRRHQRGRPPGAQNKTTRDMLDFMRKTIGDPLLESARMAMHTPEILARELGCDKLEAATLLEKIIRRGSRHRPQLLSAGGAEFRDLPPGGAAHPHPQNRARELLGALRRFFLAPNLFGSGLKKIAKFPKSFGGGGKSRDDVGRA